jgi:hypothetical protein
MGVALFHQRFGRRQLDQARIAADLPQFQQRIENHDLAAADALLGQRPAQLAVEGDAQGFVEVALAALDFDPAHHLGPRRQILQHLLLGPPQQEGPHRSRQR